MLGIRQLVFFAPFSFSCQAILCDVAVVLCKQLEEDSASFDAFVSPYFEKLEMGFLLIDLAKVFVISSAILM